MSSFNGVWGSWGNPLDGFDCRRSVVDDIYEERERERQKAEKAEIDKKLKELERLQSLEHYSDTYEIDEYAFEYHERTTMGGQYTILCYKKGQWEFTVTLEEPMSHAQFVEWCEGHERGKANG